MITSSISNTRCPAAAGLALNTGPCSRVERSRPVWATLPSRSQQPSAGKPELGCDTTGHEFGLVEPTPMPTMTAGRRPGHDIEVARPNARRQQPIDQQTGEMVGELPAVGVLEPQQHVAWTPGEGNGGDHLGAERHRRRHRQREPAGTAQHRPDPITPSTTRLKHHAPHHDEGAVTTQRAGRGSTLSLPFVSLLSAEIGGAARKAREHDVDSPSMSAIRNAASGVTGSADQ